MGRLGASLRPDDSLQAHGTLRAAGPLSRTGQRHYVEPLVAPMATPVPGRYQIVLGVDDRAIRARRLDIFYYTREVEIDEV